MKRIATFVLMLLLPAAASAVGGAFSLTAHDGSTYSLADDRGKVVVLAFGFTSCPDVCPTLLATITGALRALGPKAEEVQPLFVSLDPARDTPERLREYVTWFHPDIIGLTGSEAEIARMAEDYRVRYSYVGDTASGNYTVDHASSYYIIGRDGELSRIVPHGLPVTALTEAIEEVLKEDSSPSKPQGANTP